MYVCLGGLGLIDRAAVFDLNIFLDRRTQHHGSGSTDRKLLFVRNEDVI